MRSITLRGGSEPADLHLEPGHLVADCPDSSRLTRQDREINQDLGQRKALPIPGYRRILGCGNFFWGSMTSAVPASIEALIPTHPNRERIGAFVRSCVIVSFVTPPLNASMSMLRCVNPSAAY